jgi:predicted hotdog family 3-hydroxylacyl-ACP dehydratase
MVLIDSVEHCDDKTIECRTESHRRLDHPLAQGGVLTVWAGIEYAAQAIAIHRGMTGPSSRRRPVGFLGALRDVTRTVERLDDISQALVVHAWKLFASGSGAVYGFAVGADGKGAALLTGRATVSQS